MLKLTIAAALVLMVFAVPVQGQMTGTGVGIGCPPSPNPYTGGTDYVPFTAYGAQASISLLTVGASLTASGDGSHVPPLADAGAWPAKLDAYVSDSSSNYIVTALPYGSTIYAHAHAEVIHPIWGIVNDLVCAKTCGGGNPTCTPTGGGGMDYGEVVRQLTFSDLSMSEQTLEASVHEYTHTVSH